MSKTTKKTKTIKKYVMNEKHDDKKDKHGKKNDKNLNKSPKYDEKKDRKKKNMSTKV